MTGLDRGTPRLGTLAIELADQPGHLFRRAHQIAVSVFHDALGREVTPVQYAVLRTLQDRPGIDQLTLAQAIALDTSTVSDLAARLATKGWIERELAPRGQRRLRLTPEGAALLVELVPKIHAVQLALLGGLSDQEQASLLTLLRKFVALNDGAPVGPA